MKWEQVNYTRDGVDYFIYICSRGRREQAREGVHYALLIIAPGCTQHFLSISTPVGKRGLHYDYYYCG